MVVCEVGIGPPDGCHLFSLDSGYWWPQHLLQHWWQARAQNSGSNSITNPDMPEFSSYCPQSFDWAVDIRAGSKSFALSQFWIALQCGWGWQVYITAPSWFATNLDFAVTVQKPHRHNFAETRGIFVSYVYIQWTGNISFLQDSCICSESNVNKLKGNACQIFALLILVPFILSMNRFSLRSFRFSLSLEKIIESFKPEKNRQWVSFFSICSCVCAQTLRRTSHCGKKQGSQEALVSSIPV